MSGQETLEYIEHANLFIVPLDNERRWYRYHIFLPDLYGSDSGRHRSATGEAESHIAELHIRASQWYEDNGLELEAFSPCDAAHDVERARPDGWKRDTLCTFVVSDYFTELVGVAT